MSKLAASMPALYVSKLVVNMQTIYKQDGREMQTMYSKLVANMQAMYNLAGREYASNFK